MTQSCCSSTENLYTTALTVGVVVSLVTTVALLSLRGNVAPFGLAPMRKLCHVIARGIGTAPSEVPLFTLALGVGSVAAGVLGKVHNCNNQLKKSN